MSDVKGNSFSHAFLPGLILGLIIGGVAGAMLPDILSGSKLPKPTGISTGEHHDERGEGGMTEQELIDQALEEHAEDTQEHVDDAGEHIEDAADDATDALNNESP